MHRQRFYLLLTNLSKRRDSDLTPRIQKKKIILNSVATSSIREYTRSKIFDLGNSLINREIAFIATFSLYKSSTIFRARPRGQNSRDIRSRNITVILYFGKWWFYISATHAFWAWVSTFRGIKPRPFVARNVRYFIALNSPFLCEKCMEWFEIFRTHRQNIT